MKTQVFDSKSIKRQWYVIDAKGKVVGRLASEVAKMLIGKGKTAYSPNQDHGDYVIVLNSDEVHLTSDKARRKIYFHHSTHPGGEKYRSFEEQMKLDSTKVIRDAVWGMVPKNHLGRKIFSKLHVYKNDSHPHQAQKPEVVAL